MILSSDFSAASCYDRRKWSDIFKVLQKEKVNMRGEDFILSKIDLQVLKSTSYHQNSMYELREFCSHEYFLGNLLEIEFRHQMTRDTLT